MILKTTLFFALFCAGTTFAVDAKQSVEAKKSDLITNARIKYDGELTGPSIGNPDTFTTDVSGNLSKSPVSLLSTMRFGYAPSETSEAFVTLRLNSKLAEGLGETDILDTRIGYTESSLVKQGNFNLYGRLRSDLPTSKVSIDNGLIFGPGITFIPSYSIGNLSLSLPFEQRVYFYSENKAQQKTYFLYFAPTAEYALNETVSFPVEFEFAFDHFRDSENALEKKGIDIRPGVAIQATKNIKVVPFLNIYPENFSIRSTYIGMYLEGRIL